MKFNVCLLLLGFLTLTGVRSYGQAWQLFESENVPAGWSISGSGAAIRTVDTRSYQGNRSLEMTWAQPGSILSWQISPATSGSGHRVFSQWVRLETPLPDTRLRVELRSTNGSLRTFEMNLDFTGWRTVFVPYSSMSGSGSNSIDRVRWSLTGAPPASGALFLDQVIVGQLMDTRFQYADVQVPFVWQNREKSMWENQVHWYRQQPPSVVASLDEILEARRLMERWDARLIGTGSVSTTTVNQWEARMNEFQVRREGNRVRGNPIYLSQYPDYAFPPALAAEIEGAQGPNDFQQFTTLMLDLARGWNRTTDTGLRNRIAGMLVLMGEHLLDQGWAAGSNQGCLFLYGYQSREYMRAIYLARDVFAAADLLEEMGEAARWYGQAGSLIDDTTAPSMDFFNTLAQGQMLSILMEPDEEKRVAWLRAFSASMSRRISTLTPGDGDGFKPDGTTFHHNGHYPAYGIGAINTLGQLFDVLHENPFRFSEPARMTFRNVLLAARAYSNPLDWPIGLSGRHPFSGSIASASGAFAALSNYPDPQTGTAPDRQIAAAYVRLWGQPTGALGTLFANAGIQAENPVGFFTFPFANHAAYRSGNWMVSLKGYSRYVWSSEIYAADNRYGRYQSNGTAEIFLASGRAGSGFREAGWDWNRLPGTTGVHLPLDQLESPNAGTLMLRSSETMAGGVTAGRDGAFGFILNENRFGHSLNARKSIFAANGMLISLGTGIASSHASGRVETTLFQVALDGDRAPITLSTAPASPVSAFPWNLDTTPSTAFWAIDPVGNGFWLPPQQALRFSRVPQQSRHNKTRAMTNGDFASGWIDHGVSPSGGKYEYVILPQVSVAQINHFANRMASTAPAYEVLRQDNTLHAVRIAGPNRFGFVIYEPGGWDDLPHLIAADRQSLLWIEENASGLVVSAANPDLNPGEAENLVSPTGFTLRGLWQRSDQGDPAFLLWHENGNTRLLFPAREGATQSLRLAPATVPSSWAPEPSAGAPPPVDNFRRTSPSGSELTWDVSAESIHGYIVERMLPGEKWFQPIFFLPRDFNRIFDPDLAPDSVAWYRVRKWDETGPGTPTRSLLVFNPGMESVLFDFRTISNVNELRAQGWTSSGLESGADWYLTSQGLFLIDNSPTLPAHIVAPFPRRATGRVLARMGVARTANFHARIELMAGSLSLATIQMTTRTVGFLRGPTDIEFSDTRWDIEQGTLRDVSLEWRELPASGTMEIVLRYHGTTPSADAFHRWEIPNTPANHPDSIRLGAGFGSAVNRGLVVESLEFLSSAGPTLQGFFQAWAKAYLGDRHASPTADANGNGIADLWEFLWAQNAVDGANRPRPDLTPKVESVDGGSRFIWELPIGEEIAYRLEATEELDGAWVVLPHLEEPIVGRPGWIRLKAPAFPAGEDRFFYRIVVSTAFD